MGLKRAILGRANGKSIGLDLDILLRSRLLVQGNSGSGKSWLLRRLAEELFGKVPVLIIDPEGEFATLREQYGYVLVGKGGETPADIRSAGLVAHKLLELHASAVCDIYDLKPRDRHRWVQTFLDALIDAPKKLWQPCVVIVDESHQFAPEKGSGESEATEAMGSLSSRGRKRGFAPIFATQRLGKLRKDVAAECQNVLIGPTFMDIDRKRASEALGVPKSEERAFFQSLKLLEPGQFYGLGRAMSRDRVLITIGPVKTSHPKPGFAKHTPPPPAPSRVRSLLPKLADLPKEAEAKAQTEAELRRQLITVKRELAQAKRMQPAAEVQTVEKFVLKDKQITRLERAARQFTAASERLAKSSQTVKAVGADIAQALRHARNGHTTRPTVTTPRIPRVSPPRPTASVIDDDASLTGPEQRVLDALAWLVSVGNHEPEEAAVAFLANYTVGAGSFNNPKSKLRAKGHIEYLGGRRLRITDAGLSCATPVTEELTTDELQTRVLARLPGPEQRLLRPLLTCYPDRMPVADHAEAAGYAAGAGSYNNPRGRLRSLGLIEYPESGYVVAKPVLFLETT